MGVAAVTKVADSATRTAEVAVVVVVQAEAA